jgi:hypothetical protein
MSDGNMLAERMTRIYELDAAILAEIENGSTQFTLIYRGAVRKLAEQVKPNAPWRAVDSRLQYLKRICKIKHMKHGIGWKLIEKSKP